ncbi:hypothetical protein NEF87_004637 [Candidatus Lokiarchaeum ossiferum]|uniref:Uncharacterized protein n=1 Tax=Candidatus Lokiarchaeum ossiferum TaxID=2951803 RepID=A0ABY6I1A2_9ARCH|nr:hypothetical protein NEF87_004637 [Candidatus Lokiarchaeum sp. B-35]
MLFSDKTKKKKCPECNYIAYSPYPIYCPNCKCAFDSSVLVEENEKKEGNFTTSTENSASLFNISIHQSDCSNRKNKISTKKPVFNTLLPPTASEMKKADDLTRNLKINTKKGVIFSNQAYQPNENVGNIAISKSKISDSDHRVRVKAKTKFKADLSQDKIFLGNHGEFMKFMGIITKERQNLFSSNSKYEYFLELGSNLDYIATSILSGELDRMLLAPPKGGAEEICYYLGSPQLLFMIFGNFQDKKAAWLLNQMKVAFHELLQSRDPSILSKIELYKLTQNFEKRVLYMLEEYVKFDDIFSPNTLQSVDDFLRIDYFGLSYQSIGVISSLISSHLEITGLPPIDLDDPDAEENLIELKEALITAKIEAIAANTIANTTLMPHWISVKLGFQRYRFILFSEVKGYYISFLAEGNLELKETKLYGIKRILENLTEKPFIGVLSEFQEKIPSIKSFLQKK